jgi:hypothetical protein
MNRLAALIAALFSLAACNTLPTDRQLVGTWTAPESSTQNQSGITLSTSKQMVDITLAPDHSFFSGLHGRRPKDFGRWHLYGWLLIWDFTNPAKGHRVGHPYRDRIIKISPRELVYLQGEDDPGLEVHLTRR